MITLFTKIMVYISNLAYSALELPILTMLLASYSSMSSSVFFPLPVNWGGKGGGGHTGSRSIWRKKFFKVFGRKS